MGVSEKGGGWVGAVARGSGGVRKGVGGKGKWEAQKRRGVFNERE